MNGFARDVLFNDRTILLARKKVAIVFFCFGFVAIFMGLSSMGSWAENAGTQLLLSKERYQLYTAMHAYHAGEYERTIALCKEILRADPRNKAAVHQLAQAYLAQKRKTRNTSFQGTK